MALPPGPLAELLLEREVHQAPGGPWPELELGSRFRWFSFGAFVTSEVVEYEPAQRIAWDAKVLGGRGYHGWVLQRQAGGTFVRTEETQKGWGIQLVKPVLRPMMVRLHQRWLEGLARVAAEGRPAASVVDLAGPLNSEHGRHRRAPRAARRDPRPEPRRLAARLGRADDDARGRRRGPRRDARDPRAGPPRDVHRRRDRQPDRAGALRARRRRCRQASRSTPTWSGSSPATGRRPAGCRPSCAPRSPAPARSPRTPGSRRSSARTSRCSSPTSSATSSSPAASPTATTASRASRTPTTRCSTSTSPR